MDLNNILNNLSKLIIDEKYFDNSIEPFTEIDTTGRLYDNDLTNTLTSFESFEKTLSEEIIDKLQMDFIQSGDCYVKDSDANNRLTDFFNNKNPFMVFYNISEDRDNWTYMFHMTEKVQGKKKTYPIDVLILDGDGNTITGFTSTKSKMKDFFKEYID